MSSNSHQDASQALEQLKNLQAFIKHTTITPSKIGGTSLTNNQTAGTAISSSTIKSTRDVSKIIEIQSQAAAYRVNQQGTQTDDIELCRNCCLMSYPEKKKKTQYHETRGISDENLREWAFQQPIMDINAPCNNACTVLNNKRRCVQLCSIDDIIKLRHEFWGISKPTRIERIKKLNSILNAAWNKYERCFTYSIAKTVVCENAYFRAIGYLTEKSRLPKKVFELKNEIVTPGITMQKRNMVANHEAENAPKREHSLRYLRHTAEFFGEHGYGETVADVKFLPFDTLTEVYQEYRAKTEREDSAIFPADILMAGREVFRQAFLSVRHEMRLRTSKGAFETCSVCNAFHEILKSESSRWSVDKIDLVMKFKRLHLKLQSEEREDSEKRKVLARDTYDADGNPLYAYFEADGYTKFKCLTPRNYAFRKVKGDSKHIGNNVIGIIVVCGPIRTRFVYSMDDLVENGANMMIEVMRQAFHDLGALLSDYEGKSYNMPKSAFLQFDNCGVNKNQFMFAYLSLLVERGHFDEVRVNFLIVGHTHTTIDQYFSVITKKLVGKFVGSPMSLQYLFHDCQSPLINKMIHAHYDYKTWLLPVINSKLHHYGLPHVFIFKRRLSRAVCQHKPYSRSPRLFPVEPVHLPKDDEDLRKLSRPLVTEQLSFIGGIEAIQEALQIDETVNSKMLSSNTESDLFNRILLLKNLLQPLKDIDSRVSCELGNKMELQSEVGYLTTITAERLMSNLELIQNNNSSDNQQVIDIEDLGYDTDDIRSVADSSNSGKSNRLTITNGLIVDDPAIVPKPVTVDQLASFSKALAQLSYDETGFLLWLDYDKVDESWLQSSPVAFDYSTDLNLLVRLKLKEESLTIKLPKISAQRYNGLENAVTNIVSTSKSIIQDLRGGFYRNYQATATKPFCYNEKMLSSDEVEFYTQCSTTEGVLGLHHEQVMKSLNTCGKYDLFPIHSFSETQVKDIQTRHAELQRQREKQMQQIQYVIHTRNTSNPYLDPEQEGTFHRNVLQHAKGSKNKSATKKQTTATSACHVVDCGGNGDHSCRSKQCLESARKYCDLHYKKGGHGQHADKQLRPIVQVVTTSADSGANTTAGNVETMTPMMPATAGVITTTSTIADAFIPTLCMILECDGAGTFQCQQCKIWTCNLHGPSHLIHAAQLLRDGIARHQEGSDDDEDAEDKANNDDGEAFNEDNSEAVSANSEDASYVQTSIPKKKRIRKSTTLGYKKLESLNIESLQVILRIFWLGCVMSDIYGKVNATNDADNAFKSHPDLHQLDNYIRFNIQNTNLTNAVVLTNYQSILIRVHTVGKEVEQLSCFVGALREARTRYNSTDCQQLNVQYLNNDIARSNNMKPKDVVDWLLGCHIHVLLGHFHQGIAVESNSSAWHVQIIENEIRRLKYHLGYPSGNEVHCPVLLQDKYNYLAAIKQHVLPTLRIPLVEGTDYSHLIPLLRVFCEDNVNFKQKPMYVVKVPYTTNQHYCSVKSIKDIICEIGLLRDRYISVVPYVMVQSYLHNTVQYKVVCFNGKPLYESGICNSDRPGGDRKGYFDKLDRFKFAEQVLTEFKANCPFAQTTSLVRVDIFWCSYLNKFVVNELETLEARFDSRHRDASKEMFLRHSLTIYHANQLLFNIGKLMNTRIEPIGYPQWPQL